MKQVIDRANMAVGIAVAQAKTFSESLIIADEIISAREMFLEAHTPKLGATVVCRDNKVIDDGHTACEELTEGKEYVVTGESRDGMIFVQDSVTGFRIEQPLYKLRFEAVQS